MMIGYLAGIAGTAMFLPSDQLDQSLGHILLITAFSLVVTGIMLKSARNAHGGSGLIGKKSIASLLLHWAAALDKSLDVNTKVQKAARLPDEEKELQPYAQKADLPREDIEALLDTRQDKLEEDITSNISVFPVAAKNGNRRRPLPVAVNTKGEPAGISQAFRPEKKQDNSLKPAFGPNTINLQSRHAYSSPLQMPPQNDDAGLDGMKDKAKIPAGLASAMKDAFEDDRHKKEPLKALPVLDDHHEPEEAPDDGEKIFVRPKYVQPVEGLEKEPVNAPRQSADLFKKSGITEPRPISNPFRPDRFNVAELGQSEFVGVAWPLCLMPQRRRAGFRIQTSLRVSPEMQVSRTAMLQAKIPLDELQRFDFRALERVITFAKQPRWREFGNIIMFDCSMHVLKSRFAVQLIEDLLTMQHMRGARLITIVYGRSRQAKQLVNAGVSQSIEMAFCASDPHELDVATLLSAGIKDLVIPVSAFSNRHHIELAKDPLLKATSKFASLKGSIILDQAESENVLREALDYPSHYATGPLFGEELDINKRLADPQLDQLPASRDDRSEKWIS